VTGLLLQTPRARVRRLVRRLRHDESSPLAGRVVLVTGASSGIGEATARAAAARGATVLLVARRLEELERVRAEVEAAGGGTQAAGDGTQAARGGTQAARGRATAYACDLTDGDAVEALVEQVLGEHDAVDYLVNNAGRSIRRSLDLSYDRFHDFERTMAVNYFGPVRLTLGLLPAMRRQRFGHVVNILSWGVQLKAPKFAAYLASKTALDTWSRIAGRETYADNVTFTNMRFALVHTAMVVPTDNYEDRRGLTPEQAADRVVRALEDRPLTVDTRVGRAGELLNIAAPRLSDALMSRFHRSSPDSAAARTASSPAASQHGDGRDDAGHDDARPQGWSG
jgi:NAD(P)-dependent dehydrogenase (short-subunit alcohol dehydrogenase family)